MDKKIKIFYEPTAEDIRGIPDGLVEANVNNWVKMLNKGVLVKAERRVCQELVVSHIRYAIARGELNWEDVVFIYNGEEIPVNRWGNLEKWPEGFCDHSVRLSEKLLLHNIKKHKEENK